jgi:Fe-S cluster assembly ATP-binding protein
MLKIANLYASVEGKPILNGIDLTVDVGEIVAVMGPNGSGKSTLANTIAGHPNYVIDKGKMTLEKKDLNELKPDKRAKLGLFLASQYPVAVPGLTVNSFLWQIYKKRITNYELRITNVIEFRKWIEKEAKMLDLDPELLKRGLNDGFSGGEKKKMEILQMLVFNPKYLILDEIDSGLDVDALKIIAKTVAKVAKRLKIGVLVITHYQRILKYLEPDKVVVMDNGKIIKTGGIELVEEIENTGYGL